MINKKHTIFCLIIISLFAFVGCAQKEISPDTIVNHFLHTLQNKDYLSALSYVHNETSLSQSDLPPNISRKTWQALADAFMAKTTYQAPVTQSTTEAQATVLVTLTTIDCAAVYQSLPNTQSSQQLITDLQNEFAKDTAPLTTIEVVFTLTKHGNSWWIILDDPLINTLSGGLFDTLRKTFLL